jgi:formylglycine-generating enzyme required for sulfatase activity
MELSIPPIVVIESIKWKSYSGKRPKIPRKSFSAPDADALTRALAKLHLEARDGGTHSASGWALRNWNLPAPVAEPSSSTPQGLNWSTNSLGMTLIHLPAGTFLMGSDAGLANEKPVHRVTVGPFSLGDREVSRAQFARFIDDPACPGSDKPREWTGPDKNLARSPDYPITPMSWDDAVLFCNWLSRREKLVPCYQRKGEKGPWEPVPGANGYRLPTEEEWEYACRAGTTTEYSCGEETTYLLSYAVFRSLDASLEPCGNRLPNAWGFFDMHGNLMEWCQDWYYEAYDHPEGKLNATGRVLRGGSTYDKFNEGRSASREKNDPTARYRSQGFRVARSFDPGPQNRLAGSSPEAAVAGSP